MTLNKLNRLAAVLCEKRGWEVSDKRSGRTETFLMYARKEISDHIEIAEVLLSTDFPDEKEPFGWWGKMKKGKVVYLKKPMTQSYIKEHHDTYRHNFRITNPYE